MASPSFFNPYEEERLAIERRRKMAEQLMLQSQQQDDPARMAGGWVVPMQKTEGLAKIAQALVGAYGQYKVDEQSKDMGARYRAELATALKEADKLTRGTPEQAAIAMPSDEAGGGPERPYQPSVAPDPQAGALRLLESPHAVAQSVGAAQYQKYLDDQRRQAIMRQVMGTGGTPGAQGAPQGAIPANLQAALLSGDPAITAWAKAQIEAMKGVALRQGAPLVNQFTGQVMTQPTPSVPPGVALNLGPNGPQAYPVPGAQEAAARGAGMTTGATESAKARLDLVQVPDGSGGTVTMPRAEAVRRLGGAAAQQPQPVPPGLQNRSPEEMAAIRQVMAAQAQGQQASVTVPAPTAAQPLGTIPTERILGRTPSAAESAAEKERQVTAVKKAEQKPQAQLQVQTQLEDLRRLRTLAAEISSDKALGRATGLVGAIPSIPGSDAANAEALIDSLKAQVSGMKLQSMRDASKTGGAVGQVTEREWPRLENMIVALDRVKMDKAAFQAKLSELQREIQVAEGNIWQAFESEYGAGLRMPSAGATTGWDGTERRNSGWKVQRID